MKPVKVAQLGVTHEHAPVYTSLKRRPDLFEIVGVYDDRPNPSPAFYNDKLPEFEGAHFLTEDELLNYPGLEAVFVETPNLDLVPRALKCMERNLAIHMDKPAGDDLTLFKKLLDGCRERKLPFQMGYMFRGNPAMSFCRKLVEDGVLGDIFEIEMDMNHKYGGERYQAYLGNFKGGIMFNLGCHLIDYIVSFMGAPDAVYPFIKSTPEVDPSFKNNCMSILEYPHAMVVMRSCSRTSDSLGRRLVIRGTNGTAELRPLERFDGQPLYVQMTLDKECGGYKSGAQTIEFPPRADRYGELVEEFARMVRGEIESPYSFEHDYLVERVLLAASGYTTWQK